jgi:hypothetical protein
MKRILTFIFISIFAVAFSAGFMSCKKKAAEEQEMTEQKEGQGPATEEKKMEETKPMEKK